MSHVHQSVFKFHNITPIVCNILNFISLYIYGMASASAELDIELKSFITMLYTCEAAVYLDTMPSRKQMLKKYLISASIPISKICKALGFIESEKELDTDGQAIKEICQKLLENIKIKIEYLKNRNKNDEYVIKILCQVFVKKIIQNQSNTCLSLTSMVFWMMNFNLSPSQ